MTTTAFHTGLFQLPTPSDALSHPIWVKQISCIPRAARQSCRSLLTQIIRKVIDDSNNKLAWNELLHFNPKKGEALETSVTSSSSALLLGVRIRYRLFKSRKHTLDQALRIAKWLPQSPASLRPVISEPLSGLSVESYTPAPVNLETLQALQQKHPAAASDRRPPCDPARNQRFEPLQVSKEDVLRAFRSFPLCSSGRPDGLALQRINDLLAGATDNSLQSALVQLINVQLVGFCCKEINTIVFGGRLIAVTKKDGGIRPISVVTP